MQLKPSFRRIRPAELISYLIRASGQQNSDAVNPTPILDLLKLSHLSLDFAEDLPEINLQTGRVKAMLSISDKVVATDINLSPTQARFSTFHEIGHRVLPGHVEAIVLCTERDLSRFAIHSREKEANRFAADLLFHGERFASEVSESGVTAQAVRRLSEKYKAAIEETAWQLVEKNLKPCMLTVYRRGMDDRRIDISLPPRWEVKYSVSSPTFAQRYFNQVESDQDNPYVAEVAAAAEYSAGCPTKLVEEPLSLPDGRKINFTLEYFYCDGNVYCLLQPAEAKAR